MTETIWTALGVVALLALLRAITAWICAPLEGDDDAD